MQICVLGPLLVLDGQRQIEVAGTRLRRLLFRFVVAGHHFVSASELVDAIWADATPSDPKNALQTLVSRLRTTLGKGARIEQSAAGYRLAGAELDIDEFADLVGTAREIGGTDPTSAQDRLTRALALWRGAPFADDPDTYFARAATEYLVQERLQAQSQLLALRLQHGEALEVAAEAARLAADFPLREEFTSLLVLSLTSLGRIPEALAAYERLRSTLADELGTDPSSELQQLHLGLLRSTATPAEDASPRRNNLRASVTTFLGRDDEQRRVSDLLETSRLTTIVGPGGAGKTRLAGMIAERWADRLDDGVWLVELAPVTDPANLPQALLSSLGVRGARMLERRADLHTMDSTEQLLEALSEASCLLVVDNCEHLIAPVAELLDTLLARCPGLRVLATSREPLGIDGEALCQLGPLRLPEPTATPELAATYPAVQLFTDRASAVAAGFALNRTTIAPVIEIVRRLDGLPLAIELAAARLRVMPVTEIAARLSDRFRLLTGGSRAAMPRHRTLRAVVEWSWDLLAPDERLLAERLAVFPSGASVDSAVAVCADDELSADDIPDLLNALVEKSLLSVQDSPTVRYRMLETIREYGTERLAERSMISIARYAHAGYFAALVADAEPRLRTSDQLFWLQLLDTERDNELAALRFLGESGEAEQTLAMATSLAWYWTLLGRHSEAVTWLGFALQVAGETTKARRTMATAVHALNIMAMSFSEPDDEPDSDLLAGGRLIELEAELAELDDPDPIILLMRSMMAFFSNDRELTRKLIDEAVLSPDNWVRATAFTLRANVSENWGEIEPMREDATAALAAFDLIGDRWGRATALTNLAQVHMLDGDLDTAIAEYEQAGQALADFGASGDEALVHVRLADLHLRKGNLAAAREQAELVRAADFQASAWAQRLLADCAFAAIAVAEGDAAAIDSYCRTITDLLDERPSAHPVHDHVRSISLGAVARLLVIRGQLPAARERLTEAYSLGRTIMDLPIAASIGVAVATYGAAVGRFAAAAEVLGATAQIRGAADPTEVSIRALTERLTHELGDDFQQLYTTGTQLSRTDAMLRIDPARFD